jgi:hypothetical protein
LAAFHRFGNLDENFPAAIDFFDGSVYPAKRKIFFADRQVNPNTGTLQIVGLFSNADFICCAPANTVGCARKRKRITNALLVPQRAVTELQGTIKSRS